LFAVVGGRRFTGPEVSSSFSQSVSIRHYYDYIIWDLLETVFLYFFLS